MSRLKNISAGPGRQLLTCPKDLDIKDTFSHLLSSWPKESPSFIFTAKMVFPKNKDLDIKVTLIPTNMAPDRRPQEDNERGTMTLGKPKASTFAGRLVTKPTGT